MPSKFKVGDLVRYTPELLARSRAHSRANFRVVKIHPTQQGVYYYYDHHGRPSDLERGHDGWDRDENLELVQPAILTFTVDYSTDNVDEAMEIATILAAKLGRAVAVKRI